MWPKHVSLLFNQHPDLLIEILTRSLVYAFNIGFYALPLADKIGFAGAFGTLAGISAFTLLFPLFLVFFGERIRKAQGVPKEHQDL